MLLKTHYMFYRDPVSPHCTALAMRGTCTPWSAHPHVQRSAVRNERHEVREGPSLAHLQL